MYVAGISEFKKSVRLRIAYAFFLLDKKENQQTAQGGVIQSGKNKAKEELDIAKRLNPRFDEEFLIYRYGRIITESLESNSTGDERAELDVVDQITLQNSKTLCIEFIRQASQFHKEFWTELTEDFPSRSTLIRHGQAKHYRFED
jgi:hypothetical protein